MNAVTAIEEKLSIPTYAEAGLEAMPMFAEIAFAGGMTDARLLFDNLQRRQETTALLIEAQACLGLGNKSSALRLLKTVIQRDPARALAKDLLVGLSAKKKPAPPRARKN